MDIEEEKTPLGLLQRLLLDNPELRDKFNSEWRELYRQGVEMRVAIWRVRDKWLSKGRD